MPKKSYVKYPPDISKHTYRVMHEAKSMLTHIFELAQHAKGMVWKDTDERDIAIAQLRDAYAKQQEVEKMLRRASTLIDNRTK